MGDGRGEILNILVEFGAKMKVCERRGKSFDTRSEIVAKNEVVREGGRWLAKQSTQNLNLRTCTFKKLNS